MATEKPLFKYGRATHVDGMLSRGCFRIGTLHEYRNVEQHGNWIGDAREGTLKRTYENAFEQFSPGKPIPKGLTPFYGTTNDNASFTVTGGTFICNEVSPDYYVFSVSASYDRAIMRELGYDACVRIVQPSRFFAALTHTLRHGIKRHRLFACVYRDRSLDLNKESYVPPGLIKEDRFRAQAEMRYVWEPTDAKISPKIICCKKAARFCERYRVD